MLVGESKTVRSMRRFLRQVDISSDSLMIGGEAGTGRTGLVRMIYQKAGRKPSDYRSKIILFDDITLPDAVFYKKRKKGEAIITDNRAVFDELKRFVTHSLWITPLRERVEDIPLLVDYFSRESDDKKWSTPALMDKLLAYWWPLNVFELKRVITTQHGDEYLPWAHKSAFLSTLSVKELVSLKIQKYWEELEHGNVPGEFFHLFLESIEREVIESALQHCNNSKQKTAQLLDIHRNTLTKKLKKLGVVR